MTSVRSGCPGLSGGAAGAGRTATLEGGTAGRTRHPRSAAFYIAEGNADVDVLPDELEPGLPEEPEPPCMSGQLCVDELPELLEPFEVLEPSELLEPPDVLDEFEPDVDDARVWAAFVCAVDPEPPVPLAPAATMPIPRPRPVTPAKRPAAKRGCFNFIASSFRLVQAPVGALDDGLGARR